MNTTHFDALTRTASRRGVLHTLGVGTLAAVIGRFGVAESAGAKKKRPKKAKKGDVNKLCKSQVGGCIDTLTPACAASTDPEACVAVVQRCCPELRTCDFAGYFNCLLENAS